MRNHLLPLFLLLMLVRASLGAEAVVVFSDDFETPQNPLPSNWAMWGAEKFKLPANYTRDVGLSTSCTWRQL